MARFISKSFLFAFATFILSGLPFVAQKANGYSNFGTVTSTQIFNQTAGVTHAGADWVPTVSENITSIDIAIYKSISANVDRDVTVSIYDISGTVVGSLIASSTQLIPFSSLSSGIRYDYTFVFDFPVYVTSGTNYAIIVSDGSISGSNVYSSVGYTNSISGNTAIRDNASVGVIFPNIQSFGSSLAFQTSTTTVNNIPRVISVDSPSSGSVVTSPLTLTASFFNDSADSVRFSLSNFDTGIQLLPIDIPISVSGYGSVSTSSILSDGYYFGTVTLNGGDTFSTNSILLNFTVGTSTRGGSSYPLSLSAIASSTPDEFCSPTSASSTILTRFGCWFIVPSAQSVLNFSNLPDSLRTKIPFSYYYDIRDAITSSTLSASSSIAFPSLVVQIGTSTSPINFQWTAFSKDTVNYYVSDSASSFILFITDACLYITFAFMVFARVPKFFEHS